MKSSQHIVVVSQHSSQSLLSNKLVFHVTILILYSVVHNLHVKIISKQLPKRLSTRKTTLQAKPMSHVNGHSKTQKCFTISLSLYLILIPVYLNQQHTNIASLSIDQQDGFHIVLYPPIFSILIIANYEIIIKLVFSQWLVCFVNITRIWLLILHCQQQANLVLSRVHH